MLDLNLYPEKPKFFVFGDARTTGAGKTTELIDMLVNEMAAHESPRTTKLYDRTGDEITLDEVERITI